jgi:hypothetical protein
MLMQKLVNVADSYNNNLTERLGIIYTEIYCRGLVHFYGSKLMEMAEQS